MFFSYGVVEKYKRDIHDIIIYKNKVYLQAGSAGNKKVRKK